MKKITNLTYPIIDTPDLISLPNAELEGLVLIIKILTSNNYGYYWGRGKYGEITDYTTNKCYRIKQSLFEQLIAIINKHE
jgi:hypothetical protein